MQRAQTSDVLHLIRSSDFLPLLWLLKTQLSNIPDTIHYYSCAPTSKQESLPQEKLFTFYLNRKQLEMLYFTVLNNLLAYQKRSYTSLGISCPQCIHHYNCFMHARGGGNNWNGVCIVGRKFLNRCTLFSGVSQ